MEPPDVLKAEAERVARAEPLHVCGMLEVTWATQPQLVAAACPGPAGSLPATLPVTAVTLGETVSSECTDGACGRHVRRVGMAPWTSTAEAFDPRVLGSNPSRLTALARGSRVVRPWRDDDMVLDGISRPHAAFGSWPPEGREADEVRADAP